MKAKRNGEGRTQEPWTFLQLAEQTALRTCEAIPEHDRLLISVAMTTGMRPSEMAHLRLDDIKVDGEDPHIVVRFGRRGRATKNGKIRTVPLLRGLGVEAMRAWLEILPSYCKGNPLKIAFPYPSGARRQVGGSKFFHAKRSLFAQYLSAAGINPEVRFYDLRHTFASSLVSGLWGRPWSLEEVQPMLGHSSIAMTQRYAHLSDTTIKKAARETHVDLSAESPQSPAPRAPVAWIPRKNSGGPGRTRTRDLRIKSPQL